MRRITKINKNDKNDKNDRVNTNFSETRDELITLKEQIHHKKPEKRMSDKVIRT
jgi:hypothetical protein